MTFAADYEVLFDRLDEKLRAATRPTAELFAKVIAGVCWRVSAIVNKSGKAAGIDRLIETGAWTDGALALVELELPMWKVRRVAHEGDEWFCSLSRTPHLPVELDDGVETSHAVLALAVLRALVEARRRTRAEREPAPGGRLNGRQSASSLHRLSAGAICCDNFA